MLNEKAFREIFKVPVFNKITKKIKLKNHKPKAKTLNKVLLVVAKNKHINRKGIVELSELTGHCVDRCIDYLLDNNLLNREPLGKAGGYVTYSYTVA